MVGNKRTASQAVLISADDDDQSLSPSEGSSGTDESAAEPVKATRTGTKYSIPNPMAVFAALEQMFTAHEFADAKIVAGEGRDSKTFPVHAALLSCRSQFFRTCFYGGYAETSKKVLRKPNVAPAVMEPLLRFLYSGTIELGDDAQFSMDLLVAADEMGLTEAAQLIAQHIVSRIVTDSSTWVYGGPCPCVSARGALFSRGGRGDV